MASLPHQIDSRQSYPNLNVTSYTNGVRVCLATPVSDLSRDRVLQSVHLVAFYLFLFSDGEIGRPLSVAEVVADLDFCVDRVEVCSFTTVLS